MDIPVDHPVARRHIPTPEERAKAREERRRSSPERIQDALSRVDPTRHAQITKIALSCPPMHLGRYLRSVMGKESPAEAIKCMCFHCVGWENARFEVANCTAKGCPLWAYRPTGPEASDCCEENEDGRDISG